MAFTPVFSSVKIVGLSEKTATIPPFEMPVSQESEMALKLVPFPEIKATIFFITHHISTLPSPIDLGEILPISHEISPSASRKLIADFAWSLGSTMTRPTPQLNVRYISCVLMFPRFCSHLNMHLREGAREPAASRIADMTSDTIFNYDRQISNLKSCCSSQSMYLLAGDKQ